MNMKLVLIVSIVFSFSVLTNISDASIDDVYITPEIPSTTDIISINVLGTEGSGPVDITDTDLGIDGTSLTFDMFLDVGPFTVVTPWSHTEDIGTLPLGIYDLTVNTFEMSQLTDSYPITFEVVPEPTSLLFLIAGSLGICRCSRRRNQ